MNRTGAIMGNDALDAIRAQIKTKRALLTRLNDQIQEFKRLQGEIAKIPTIKADVEALERALAIIKGEEGRQETPRTGLQQVMDSFGEEPGVARPVAFYVATALKEAGKPLPFSQIIPLIAAKGCTANEPTVRGAIYRNVKSERLFKLVTPGVIGLLEWNNR